MIRSSKHLWTALAGLILLAASARGQMPDAFTYIPGDAQFVARIDFQQAQQNPQLAQVLQSVQAKEADYRADLALSTYSGLAANIPQLVEGFPGEILIMEAAGREITSQQPPTYAALFGRFDAAALATRLKDTGWTQAESYKDTHIYVDANKLVHLTMPNGWTVFVTLGIEDLHRMIDIAGDPSGAPNLARAGKSISASLPAAARSYFFFNLDVSPELGNKFLAMGLDQASQQGMQIPPEARQQAQTEMERMTRGVRSVLFSVAENQGFRLNFAIDFENEQARDQLVVQLNQGLAIGGMMLYSQAQGDPNMIAVAQALQQSQFQTNGNRAYLSILIPPSALQSVIEEMQKK